MYAYVPAQAGLLWPNICLLGAFSTSCCLLYIVVKKAMLGAKWLRKGSGVVSGDELILEEVKASRTATGYGPVIFLSMQYAFHVAAVLFHVAAVLGQSMLPQVLQIYTHSKKK